MFESDDDPRTVLLFDFVELDLATLFVPSLGDETTGVLLTNGTLFFLTGAGSGSGAAQTPQLPPELQCLQPEQFLQAVQ